MLFGRLCRWSVQPSVVGQLDQSELVKFGSEIFTIGWVQESNMVDVLDSVLKILRQS
jgi:hypothetical protein